PAGHRQARELRDDGLLPVRTAQVVHNLRIKHNSRRSLMSHDMSTAVDDAHRDQKGIHARGHRAADSTRPDLHSFEIGPRRGVQNLLDEPAELLAPAHTAEL